MTSSNAIKPSILIIGASGGIGHAMAAEFLARGWHVTGTARPGRHGTELHVLAAASNGCVDVEYVDVAEPEQIATLRRQLSGRRFDMLFVNAGTANTNQKQTVAEVATEEFIDVMVTNALGPMRMIEALRDSVLPNGLIGIMSSGQGSITNNTNGRFDVYRGSKAALNQYMRGYAARHADDPRALLLLAPGWIRTAMGGPDAPFSLDEATPDIVDTLIAKRGRPGLEFLDRMGKTVPW